MKEDSFDPFADVSQEESPGFSDYMESSPSPAGPAPAGAPVGEPAKKAPKKRASGDAGSSGKPHASSQGAPKGSPQGSHLVRLTGDVLVELRRWAVAWSFSEGSPMSPNKVVRELLRIAESSPQAASVRRIRDSLKGLS